MVTERDRFIREMNVSDFLQQKPKGFKITRAREMVLKILNGDKGKKNKLCNKKETAYNEYIKECYARDLGDKSIMGLLPTNSVHFRPTTDLLTGYRCPTKELFLHYFQSDSDVAFITRGNVFQRILIGAMRDLATAESRAQSPKNPQA